MKGDDELDFEIAIINSIPIRQSLFAYHPPRRPKPSYFFSKRIVP